MPTPADGRSLKPTAASTILLAMAPAHPIIAVTRTIPGTISVPNATIRLGTNDLMPRARIIEHARAAHVLVTMYTDKVDDALLDAIGPQLMGVCNFAVGVDNIDLPACRRRGIKVGNTPDAVTEGTANMALTLMLATARRLVEGDRFARSGAWLARGPMGMAEFMGLDLCGKLILIVGAGRIGYATATRAMAFGMRVGYVARSRHTEFELAPLAARRYDLDEGLAVADVVSLHTPLTPDTRHLINSRRLGLLKPQAILINTARGPIIDESALVEHLRARKIWGAGLDVFEKEPALAPGLAELDNVVMMPHLGSAEVRWRALMAKMVEENCLAILDGRDPPHGV